MSKSFTVSPPLAAKRVFIESVEFIAIASSYLSERIQNLIFFNEISSGNRKGNLKF